MKIFSWIRSKRNGNEGSNTKPNPQPKSYEKKMTCNEEFSDWPNALLAIGTFGNNANPKNREPVVESEESTLAMKDEENLSVEHLINCLRGGGDEGGDRRLERLGSLVERGGKDIKSDKRNRGIGKRSLSFLLKKALLCGGGFTAALPIIRDPLPDLKIDQSTMEKILRAMLHKKIYPQRPTTPNKCLDMGEEDDTTTHGSKWDKTDSEYIVLEI
ncbi:protein NEGATIVE GRAVITROPIC RESPONSE OF ROOTS-like [Salvia splendens]|uniref:protein NEGATIVE GRAVITROPIC RESPONSE OF ROOTS-like n=1 Tax=Salvia splendens TaxID=180675 RepID=UPI001C26FA4F|nr:protein NEGATIVE GRAVITROPIC RESPONSE OF ROOTS-like [Salvia splendens]